MIDSSPIVVTKPESLTQASCRPVKNQDVNDPIFDTRFQSFVRVYIFDLINADPCDHLNNNQEAKRSIIRIDNLYVSKVCICGNIVGIYESAKYYRLKIDDSTGCINVTLWKDALFQENSLDLSISDKNSNIQGQFSELYNLLGSIQSRIKENTVNNSIMYEPKQGDLILIRANVKCFRQRIELNAISCTRVQNSTEELIHMMLPACLAEKTYSIAPPTESDYVQFRIKNEKIVLKTMNEPDQHVSEARSVRGNEQFLNFVYKKLTQMANSNVLDSSRKVDQLGDNTSCESYALFSFLRNNCPIEFKYVNHKQVLEALKELELRGLVYSCEDEFHYLPLI